MVVIVILGILATVVTVNFMSAPDEARQKKARLDIVTLEAVGEGTTTVTMHNCFRCDDRGNTPPEHADQADDVTFTIRVR